MNNEFLPITAQELRERGIERPDFIYVSGDAYVDHPSFGAAIITRVLEAEGFSVAFMAQPDVKSDADFLRFGAPRFGFFVSSGNIDSMVAHYTAAGKPRSRDLYSPGGAAGRRPDRAVTVYCRALRRLFGSVPIVIGGLEASLRRFAHYDYWSDSVRESVLIESGADMISYGMGEHQTRGIAHRLAAGESIADMRDIPGTCFAVPSEETPFGGTECPSYENVKNNKKEYAKACRIQHDEQDSVRGRMIKQRHGKMTVVQLPPSPPLDTRELDEVYALPFTRRYHPSYEPLGGVPALEEVEFSVTHNRGCFGDCNFCALAMHQGRAVTSRSIASVVSEVKQCAVSPGFKGYISDVGGPTANFRAPSCRAQLKNGMCKGKKCLAPEPCKALEVSHADYLELLRAAESVKGVKKVFIRSGVRYDYALRDGGDEFIKELAERHVSGQLRVAPEHCVPAVLDLMGKPHIDDYLKFVKKFDKYSRQAGLEQYVVPYMMSSHPGCTLADAAELAVFLKKENIRPEQVQDFYPTPGTISTAMFYTGLDLYTMKEIYVPRTPREKELQRALLQYYVPQNADKVREALLKAGRADLIGTGKNCLVSDRKSPPQGTPSKRRQPPRGAKKRGRR